MTHNPPRESPWGLWRSLRESCAELLITYYNWLRRWFHPSIIAGQDDLKTSPLLPRFFPAEVLRGIAGFRRGMKNLCFFGVFSQNYWAENGDVGSNPAGRTNFFGP